jgi:hypothetical protein
VRKAAIYELEIPWRREKMKDDDLRPKLFIDLSETVRKLQEPFTIYQDNYECQAALK